MQYEQGLNSGTDIEQLRYCREGLARCLIKCGNTKKGISIALEIGSKKLLNECAELLENTKVYKFLLGNSFLFIYFYMYVYLYII